MRVLFITSTFPVASGDPQVPWLLTYVKKLQSHGVKVDVFAPASRGSSSHSLVGVSVSRFRYAPASWEILTHDEGALFKLRGNKLLFFLLPLYFIFGGIAIVLYCLRHRYDVIHVHWPFPQAIFGIIAKILCRAKLVYSVYGAEFTLVGRVPLGKTIFRAFLLAADAVVCISSYTAKRTSLVAGVPIEIIPFQSALPKHGVVKKSQESGRNMNILFVGRLIERKGIRYLLDALALLRKKQRPVHLGIVGQGRLSTALVEEVRRLGLEGAVTFHGGVDGQTLVEHYANADIFVLPAIIDRWGDTEGLGVVILEAMSFEIPVIATRVGGISDIIADNKNGLLVDQKNAVALAAAIERLINSTRLRKRLRMAGLATYRRDFSWKKIVKRTISVYSA